MLTIIRYYLRRSLGQILGWGIGLGVIGVYLVQFYDTIQAQRGALEQLLAGYPPELFAFFGDVTEMFTPAGYLDTYFFSYMPIVFGIFAVLAGSGLLASDEERGTLDLILAHPIRRTGLFWGRLLGFVLAILLILLIVWVGFAVTLPSTSLGFGIGELALPFISLLGLMILFGTLALLLSQILPSSRLAAMLSGLVLVAAFFITSLERVNPDLESIAFFSPLNYYQAGGAVAGLDFPALGMLLGFSLLFSLLAWWQFQRRDIRVGGEGGWSLPSLQRKRA